MVDKDFALDSKRNRFKFISTSENQFYFYEEDVAQKIQEAKKDILELPMEIMEAYQIKEAIIKINERHFGTLAGENKDE